jgi:hypothetical protein
MDEYSQRYTSLVRPLQKEEVERLMCKTEKELSNSDIVSLLRNEHFVKARYPQGLYKKFPYRAIHQFLSDRGRTRRIVVY